MVRNDRLTSYTMTANTRIPSRACRRLFQTGEDSNLSSDKNLSAVLHNLNQNSRRRWNFDFLDCKPFQGRFVWIAANSTPGSHRNDCSPVENCINGHDIEPSKNGNIVQRSAECNSLSTVVDAKCISDKQVADETKRIEHYLNQVPFETDDGSEEKKVILAETGPLFQHEESRHPPIDKQILHEGPKLDRRPVHRCRVDVSSLSEIHQRKLRISDYFKMKKSSRRKKKSRNHFSDKKEANDMMI